MVSRPGNRGKNHKHSSKRGRKGSKQTHDSYYDTWPEPEYGSFTAWDPELIREPASGSNSDETPTENPTPNDEVDVDEPAASGEPAKSKLVTTRLIVEKQEVTDGPELETLVLQGGWKVVVQRGHNFCSGQRVVYFAVGSFIPATDRRMWDSQSNMIDFRGQRGYHVYTRAICGHISQGLVFHLESCPEILQILIEARRLHGTEGWVEASERAFDEVLGVTKWEPKRTLMSHLELGPPLPVLSFPIFCRRDDHTDVGYMLDKFARRGCKNARNEGPAVFSMLASNLHHQRSWWDTFQVTEKLDGATMAIYHLAAGSDWTKALPDLPQECHEAAFTKDGGRVGVCVSDAHLAPIDRCPFWEAVLRAKLPELIHKMAGATFAYDPPTSHLDVRGRFVDVKSTLCNKFADGDQTGANASTDAKQNESLSVPEQASADNTLPTATPPSANRRQLSVRVGHNIAIFCEICRPKVHGYPPNLSRNLIYAFSIYDIDRRRYLPARATEAICASLGILHVPVIGYARLWQLAENLEELYQLAEGESRIGPVNREGIILRKAGEHSRSKYGSSPDPRDDLFSMPLDEDDEDEKHGWERDYNREIVKVHSNSWLLQNHIITR